MPPMQEPKLIELGKLLFGAAGVAASIVIHLAMLPTAQTSSNFQIVMNLVERFPVMTKRSIKAEVKKATCAKKERT